MTLPEPSQYHPNPRIGRIISLCCRDIRPTIPTLPKVRFVTVRLRFFSLPPPYCREDWEGLRNSLIDNQLIIPIGHWEGRWENRNTQGDQ